MVGVEAEQVMFLLQVMLRSIQESSVCDLTCFTCTLQL